MSESEPADRVITDFTLAYVAEGDKAAILGFHVPTPEQQAAGLMPHWEPLITFGWDQVPIMSMMLLDAHADLSPIVERKRQLQAGDLTSNEAWAAAKAEMRPELQGP